MCAVLLMRTTTVVTYDLAIVGAGPAGAEAALQAGRLGLRTLVIDEQAQAGGQVWRSKGPAIRRAPATAESLCGDRLRGHLAHSKVNCLFGNRVWSIETSGGGFGLSVTGPGGAKTISARALLLTTGAQERVVPVPGWTLPGVIGLGAATALMKEQMIVPGGRVVVAGSGPLMVFVAHEIMRYGGQVAAVVDLNPRSAWLAAVPAMAARPDLLMRGSLMVARMVARGVPLLTGHGIRRIEGVDGVERVAVGPVDRAWSPTGNESAVLDADSVCMGHGLTPAIEASRLLGAAHVFDEAEGGWRPVRDRWGRTSVAGLYVAGDGAGVQGAAAAQFRGRLSAVAIAREQGIISVVRATRMAIRLRAGLVPAARFGRAMVALTAPRSGLIDAVTPATVVCRCEGVTRHDLDVELDSGGVTANALKSGTRCGMGSCGGRFCADTAAMVTCRARGIDRADVGLATARPPLRPVQIGGITGDFDYDDLPIPAPSPL